MDVRGTYYIPSDVRNQPVGTKRKCSDCYSSPKTLYYRAQPIVEGKKRFWADLFYEKTSTQFESGSKKSCTVVKQDNIEFVVLKEKIDLQKNSVNAVISAVHEERDIQITLSSLCGFVQIVDSFLVPSRKEPHILKWITIAEKFDGNLTQLSKIRLRYLDSYIYQIALRIRDIHSKNIVIEDLKLDNLLFRNVDHVATITDFGGAHIAGITPSRKSITIGYNAPEISRDKIGDYASDIFSFGVCMVELVYKGKLGHPTDKIDPEANHLPDPSKKAQYCHDIIEWQNLFTKHKYRPLMRKMTDIDPSKRPNIHQVIHLLDVIQSKNPKK